MFPSLREVRHHHLRTLGMALLSQMTAISTLSLTTYNGVSICGIRDTKAPTINWWFVFENGERSITWQMKFQKEILHVEYCVYKRKPFFPS